MQVAHPKIGATVGKGGVKARVRSGNRLEHQKRAIEDDGRCFLSEVVVHAQFLHSGGTKGGMRKGK